MTQLKNDKEVQTRNIEGELRFFETIRDAWDHALNHDDVWKVSWDDSDTHERVRFVRADSGDWRFEPIDVAVPRVSHRLVDARRTASMDRHPSTEPISGFTTISDIPTGDFRDETIGTIHEIREEADGSVVVSGELDENKEVIEVVNAEGDVVRTVVVKKPEEETFPDENGIHQTRTLKDIKLDSVTLTTDPGAPGYILPEEVSYATAAEQHEKARQLTWDHVGAVHNLKKARVWASSTPLHPEGGESYEGTIVCESDLHVPILKGCTCNAEESGHVHNFAPWWKVDILD